MGCARRLSEKRDNKNEASGRDNMTLEDEPVGFGPSLFIDRKKLRWGSIRAAHRLDEGGRVVLYVKEIVFR